MPHAVGCTVGLPGIISISARLRKLPRTENLSASSIAWGQDVNEGRNQPTQGGAVIAFGTVPELPKVFCVGFNKTGTTMLHRLFSEQLGYRSDHNPKWTDWSIASGTRELDRHDVFSDGGCASIRELDRLYPDARFVLNMRSLKRWVLSRHKAVERSRAAVRWALTKYVPLGLFASGVNRWVLENDENSMLRWIAVRNSFHRHVIQYFSERPDKLLILDIEDDLALQNLSRFLGVDTVLEAKTANAEGHGSTTRIILDAIGAKMSRDRSERAVGALFEKYDLARHADELTWFESDVHHVGRSASDRVLQLLPFMRPLVQGVYVRLVRTRSKARSFMAKWLVDTFIRFFRSERDLHYFTTVRRLGSASQ
jgi:hypothetical protein